MPLYEYRCSSCNKTHELMQKFSDPPLEKCPDCGKPVEKLMSLSSFALKGSGWYTSDYKRSGSSSSPAGEASSTTKTETAPAETQSKTEPKSDS